ncbi:hypothetical protein SUGI_1120870 [Cryptomeria japonica]|nr:hypothetical protein SUGI_1120870 [Cryptomeria japonica]
MVVKFIAKGFFVVLFEEKEERNRALTDRNCFVNSHAVYIQPWTPHFDPTPLAFYSEPVWIRLYNLPIEYWSEELWEKIGITLGTLLETYYDDEEDICKSARMRIAAVKRIPESIILVSECGERIQKVEIEKHLSRCPRCGSKFHGDKENRMENMEIAKEKDGGNKGKENNFESLEGNIIGSSNNTEEDCRGISSRDKGLSDTEFDYERGSDDELFQTNELVNIDPRCISQSANILLGKAKGVRGRRSNQQKREDKAKEKGIIGVMEFIKKTKGEGISLGKK